MEEPHDTTDRLKQLLDRDAGDRLEYNSAGLYSVTGASPDGEDPSSPLSGDLLGWVLEDPAPGAFARMVWRQVSEPYLYIAQAQRFFHDFGDATALEFPALGGCRAVQALREVDGEGFTVLGDRTERSLRAAGSDGDRPEGLALLHAADDRLPFRPDVFDAALCQTIWTEPEKVSERLSEFARVLKPGGVLWLSLYCRGQSKLADFVAGTFKNLTPLGVEDYIHTAEDTDLHLEEQWHYGTLYQLELKLH